MADLTIPAKLDKLDDVLDFVNGLLEQNDCQMKPQMQIDIAVEELFVNIAHYAYPEGDGSATITVDFKTEPKTAVITFIDRGIPYDPLQKKDPDVTLSAEDRKIGGLGIYMVKKSMDDVYYRYENSQNILTIEKKI